MAATSNRIPVAAPSPAVVWQQYRRTGDTRLRDRLIFTLAPLVRHAGATTPEQAQAGLSALLIAVERYSPAADGPIESFAWAQIRSALASA
jgi:DNA-directed RNA polymerase specialized sigma subunit